MGKGGNQNPVSRYYRTGMDNRGNFPSPPVACTQDLLLRLFLTVTWKSGLGNFSGTNISHVTFGGNLLHQDTVWDFPELFSRQLCSRKFCQISKSNSQRLEISGSPKETYYVPFLERSIFGCWFKSIFGTKRTLWEKLPSTFFRQPPATLLALLSGACSKTDFQVPISKSP